MKIADLYRVFQQSDGVSKDSRSTAGRIYFALRGERFDGNDFALSALEQGASAVVVAADSGVAQQAEVASFVEAGKVFVAEDPLKTLQDLARYHRSRFRIPVIALTGTNGKTTTKELVRAALSAKYRVTATQGNLNNHIGVPLTLLEINSDTEIAIVEMGASAPKEIALLASIALPTFGLITNVGTAHILGFGSFEGVQQAKGELYDYLQRTADLAFVNVANPHLQEMARMRPDLRVQPYSLDLAGARVAPITWDQPFLRLSFEDGSELSTKLVGHYNADNVMAALAVADYFGVPRQQARAAVAAYEPANNRSQLLKTDKNLLVVDAYNANPSSMAAALESFSRIESPNKGVILGDMRELGVVSETEHRKVMERVAGMDLKAAWFVGELFGHLNQTWSNPAIPVRFFANVEALKQHLKEATTQQMTWLIKGSNGIGLQQIIQDL